MHYFHKHNPSFSLTCLTNNGINFLLPFYTVVVNYSAVFFSGNSISSPAGRGLQQHKDGSQGIQRCTCQKPSPGSGKALLI